MEVKNPQNSCYEKAKKCSWALDILGVVSIVISLIQPIYQTVSPRIFLIISGLVLIVVAIIENFQKKYYNEAHIIREKVLLDNSFNAKKIPNYNSDLYFNNYKIKESEVKLLANLHENTLYTSKIVGKMVIKYYIISFLACLILFIKFSYSGMDDYTSILLGFVLSGSFFKRALSIGELKKVSDNIYEEINVICSNFEKGNNKKQILLREIFELLLRYENTLYESKVILNSIIFKKYNDEIGKEWENIKLTYKIYQE
ncbi:hypothetical protein [Gemella haemolysans]|uniref:hypothetical protein n=1 Tax=Gemella haemolysans TaxID=1379 RepID=UPI0028D10CD0|nr:hypothetical protein [Gemella haemolysans]